MMQAERSRRSGSYPQLASASLWDGGVSHTREFDGFATVPASSSSSLSSPSSPPFGVNYIEHRVSKMDTLAGVAIKYGVEVADIKRMNGLAADLQMFAMKSLQIPLPGRHPPSPCLSNGSVDNGEQTPPRQPRNDILDSIQSLKLKTPPCRVSQAMSSLQGYYGLTTPNRGSVSEGTEMAVYRTRRSLCLQDESLPRDSRVSRQFLDRHRKSRSMVFFENGEITEDKIAVEAVDNSDAEKSIRRRQKGDSNPPVRAPELLLEDGNGGFSGRTGKGLALRPKSGSRTDMDMGRPNATPLDPIRADGFISVRKSSSTSNLQDSDNCSSIWPTGMWNLKTDCITRPIFDGLPKPVTARRNKAALD